MKRCASPIIAVFIFTVFCASASGSIYWGDGSRAGRVNLDGSYPMVFWGRWEPSGVSNICGVAVSDQHLFWADSGLDVIGRSDLDGTDVELSYIAASEPCGVAVNGDHLFWANRGGGTIGRARTDGSEVIQDFVAGLDQPCGVASDSSHLYWGDLGKDIVARAPLDGKGAPDTLIEETYGVCALAVNQSHLFWGGYTDGIGRSGLDGASPNRSFIPGIDRPCGIAIDAGRIYWSEQGGGQRGQLGIASLDGTLLNRSFLVDEVINPCGIAVDSLAYVPSAPTQANFTFGKVKHNRRKGIAYIPLRFPSRGSVEVGAHGLSLRFLPGGSGKINLDEAGERWLRVSLDRSKKFGRRAWTRLRKSGKLSVAFEVLYLEGGSRLVRKVKKLNLVMIAPRSRLGRGAGKRG